MALDPIKTLETALKINRPAAVLVTGGFLVLALAAALGNHFKDSGLTFWHIPLALLGFSILVAVFARMSLVLATVACWTLMILALLYAVGVTGQVLAGNTLPYAKLDCLTGFWKPGACNTSPIVVPDAVPADEPVVAEDSSAGAQPAAAVDRASTEVYIQFTGLERDAVKAIATNLLALGWPVQGGDQGGERYDHAAGLNEVRFFNAADKARAEALAHELSAAMSGQAIDVLDVTDSAYAMDTPGHLEIWISK
ncbi:MAG: hypothetical protein ACKO2N_13320 [Tabrizicola sp.]